MVQYRITETAQNSERLIILPYLWLGTRSLHLNGRCFVAYGDEGKEVGPGYAIFISLDVLTTSKI